MVDASSLLVYTGDLALVKYWSYTGHILVMPSFLLASSPLEQFEIVTIIPLTIFGQYIYTHILVIYWSETDHSLPSPLLLTSGSGT
jgi:hypothetical protein